MNLEPFKISEQERTQNGVTSAPDTLTGTAKHNKGVFDRLVGFFVDKYNLLLVALQTFIASSEAHIASMANPHGVTKAQVGLGNVNNTSDTDKPISTAQAAVNSQLSQGVSAAQGSADAANQTAAAAVATANAARQQSGEAVTVAAAASAAAAQATTTAGNALTVAQGIAATAQSALAAAQDAARKAQDATYTAEAAYAIAERAGIAKDPVTGLYVPVSAALQSIYDMVKPAPMTANDFANNAITVDFFRSKNMTVTEFAQRGKQILIGG